MSNNGYCPSCGTEQVPGLDSCQSCNRTFVIQEVTKAFCPACGSSLFSNEEACPNCNRKFAVKEINLLTSPTTTDKPTHLPTITSNSNTDDLPENAPKTTSQSKSPNSVQNNDAKIKPKDSLKFGNNKDLNDEAVLFIKAGEFMADESEHWYRQCLLSQAGESVGFDGEGMFRVRLMATTYVGTAFISRWVDFKYISMVNNVTSELSAIALKPFLENKDYPEFTQHRAKVMGNFLVQSVRDAMISELNEPDAINHQTDGFQILAEEYRMAFEGSLPLGELSSKIFDNHYSDPIKKHIETSIFTLRQLMKTDMSLENLDYYISSNLSHKKMLL